MNDFGNLLIQPNSSSMRKLVARYLKIIKIKICEQDDFEVIEGVPVLFINPHLTFIDTFFSYETIIVKICDSIILQEASNNQENCNFIFEKDDLKNTFVVDKKDQTSFFNFEIDKQNLCNSFVFKLECLELISQKKLMLRITNLASILFNPDTFFSINFHLITNSKKFNFSNFLRTNLKVLNLGRNFYDDFSFFKLGLLIKRSQKKFCNPCYYIQKLDKKLGTLKESELGLIPKKPNDFYLKHKITIKKEYFSKGKSIICFFYKNTPLALKYIGSQKTRLIEKRFKFEIFSTKDPKSEFNPIFKSKNLANFNEIRSKLSKTEIFKNGEFTCFLLSKTAPDLSIKTGKNKPVPFNLINIPNNSIYETHDLYKLSFVCQYIGNYLLFDKGQLIASDFLVYVSNYIDPNRCELVYDKFLSVFKLHLFDYEGNQYYLSNLGQTSTNSSLKIDKQEVVIKVFNENGIVFDVSSLVIFI